MDELFGTRLTFFEPLTVLPVPAVELRFERGFGCFGERQGDGSELLALRELRSFRQALGDGLHLVELALLDSYAFAFQQLPDAFTPVNDGGLQLVAHSLQCICCHVVIYGPFRTLNARPVQCHILATGTFSIRVNDYRHTPAPKVGYVHDDRYRPWLVYLNWRLVAGDCGPDEPTPFAVDPLYLGDRTTPKGVVLPYAGLQAFWA
jgi:hypothetical protein